MWKDSETNKDLLGYQVHASLLKEVVLDKNMLPISIGIFGNWGSGKSSLMLLLHNEISQWVEDAKIKNENEKEPAKKENNLILQIQFNSWQFENYENTKLTLIETILDSISKDIEQRKDVFEKADDLIGRIKFLKVGTLVLKKIASQIVPEGIQEMLPTKEELKECLEPDEAESLITEIQKGNIGKFISQFRRIFESIVIEANYRAVIVYIDDLDRCIPKRVIECLEAVKLFLNVERTAFIIGADERAIEYAISQHYPLKTDKDDQFSPFSDYLEKLIQLPYKLPKLSFGEQETYIFLLLCQQLVPNNFPAIHENYMEFKKSEKRTKYDIEKVKKAFPKISLKVVEDILSIVPLMNRFLNGNPRQLKRFLNTFDLRKKMASVVGFNDFDPTILVKLMVLEYNSVFQSRFEELHRRQLMNGGFVDGIEAVENEVIGKKAISVSDWEKDWSSPLLIEWMKMPPSLANKNLQNYFWIARDSLKNSVPVESVVNNFVMATYARIKKLQSITTMTSKGSDVIGKFSSEEKDMFVMLMNSDLRQDVNDKKVWWILQADDKNSIFEDKAERLSLLFNKLKTTEILPVASFFIKRISSISDDFKGVVASLPFNDKLKNALK